MDRHGVTLQRSSGGWAKTPLPQFNSMIFVELSYYPLKLIKELRIPSPIQISIIASVLRPKVPNTPILSVDQPQN